MLRVTLETCELDADTRRHLVAPRRDVDDPRADPGSFV
jgi:hypothetical protein